MKSVILVLSIVVASFFTSSVSNVSHSLRIGEKAPVISVSKVKINFDRSKEKILNFWSVKDASSRIVNHKMSEMAESGRFENIQFISVCLDTALSISEEVSKLDHISSKIVSLSLSELNSEVFGDYQLEKGCRVYKIDSYGNLVSYSTQPGEIPD